MPPPWSDGDMFGVRGGNETKQSMIVGGPKDNAYNVVIPKPTNIVHDLSHAAVSGYWSASPILYTATALAVRHSWIIWIGGGDTFIE